MCPNYKVMPFLPVIFQELLFTDQQSKLPIQKNKKAPFLEPWDIDFI
jgi:hypothetical protein